MSIDEELIIDLEYAFLLDGNYNPTIFLQLRKRLGLNQTHQLILDKYL